MEVSSLTTMQAELTARWNKACAYMDSGKPLSKAFWNSLSTFWAAMEVFDAVENSYRRDGLQGCINAPDACTEAMAMSCRACASQVTLPTLSGDSGVKGK